MTSVITPGRIVATAALTAAAIAGGVVLVRALDGTDDAAARPTLVPSPSPGPAPTPPADARSGAEQLDPPTPQRPVADRPPIPAPTPPPIRTTPGDHLVTLTKSGPRAADRASDPAAFRALLEADGPGWAAADGTISIPLADGKVLWLFGDTLLNLPGANGTLRRNADFVRNSAILQDGASATTLVTGSRQDAGDFLSPKDAREWYWPGHGVVEGDELVVFMERVGKTAAGGPGWNFEGRGSDMLRLDLRDLSVKERVSMPGAGQHVSWGQAVVEHGPHSYVFGFKGNPDDGLDRRSVLARAPRGELGTGRFEYWDGSGWTRDASKVAAVATGVSNSYSVVPTPDGRFAMVSQELFFGTKLNARTADSPEGPWSEWRTIDEGPRKEPGTISYNAQVHPTFTADGKVLASWNMNRDDAKLPRPDELGTYRPVFRAIDAHLLDEG